MAKILVVDDMATVIISHKMTLAGMGHTIRTAMDGVMALEEVQREAPDLVLCDMVMPLVDGPEFCRRMRSSARTRHIPIIMVTTQTQSERVRECLDAGCDGFLSKPIDKKKLREKIDAVLSARSKSMASGM